MYYNTGIYLFMFVIIVVIALAARVVAINLLIKVGRAKGYAMENAGILWFVGIFATPILVGLYIASLPDNRTIAGLGKPAEAELPKV